MSHEEKETYRNIAFDEYEPFDPASPEKSLLKAVLLSAINDLKKPGEAQRRATEYFLNRDERYLFSFVSICDHLSIDPNKILVVAGLKPSLISASANQVPDNNSK